MGAGDGISIPSSVAAARVTAAVCDTNEPALGEEQHLSKKKRRFKKKFVKVDPYLVGYQIRFDASTTKEGRTKIKFMTDGILLKEIIHDLLLRR